MTDRERLIEILKVPIHQKIGVDPAEVVADYLLDNGLTFMDNFSVKTRSEELLNSPCKTCKRPNCLGINCPIFVSWFNKAWEKTRMLYQHKTNQESEENNKE